MPKMKIIKAPKKPANKPKTLLEQITEARDLRDLLKIKGLILKVDGETVQSVIDLHDEVERHDFDFEDGFRIEATLPSCTVSVNLMEQPSCCANMLMHGFGHTANNLSAQKAYKAIYLLAKEIADADNKTNLWFTNHTTGVHADSAIQQGFFKAREYVSRGTGSRLADFYYEL